MKNISFCFSLRITPNKLRLLKMQLWGLFITSLSVNGSTAFILKAVLPLAERLAYDTCRVREVLLYVLPITTGIELYMGTRWYRYLLWGILCNVGPLCGDTHGEIPSHTKRWFWCFLCDENINQINIRLVWQKDTLPFNWWWSNWWFRARLQYQ